MTINDLIEVKSESAQEALSEVEQSYGLQAEKCTNGAPFICFEKSPGYWVLAQGCCNNWTCPRCGYMRARAEYGRMVHGANELEKSGETMFFLTITCRGGDMTPATAEREYMKWTNRLLSTCRARAKKQAQTWAYVQVTEYQKRGVPHSHLLSTFCPDDAVFVGAGKRRPDGITAKHDCLYSEWFQKKNVSAGLGPMCDISQIRSAVGVAVYVSKYLFKDAVFTAWPKSWKRIRYSHSWPKLPDLRGDNDAFPVLTMSDWSRVRNMRQSVIAQDVIAYEAALARLVTNVLRPKTGTCTGVHRCTEIDMCLLIDVICKMRHVARI